MIRRLIFVVVLILLALAAASCGDAATNGASKGVETAVAYLPTDAVGVGIVSTDLEGEGYQALQDLVNRAIRAENENLQADQGTVTDEGADASVEEEEFDLTEQAGNLLQASWEDDIKPVLGNELVFAASRDESFVGALLTGSAKKTEALLEKVGAVDVKAVDGARVLAIDEGVFFALDDNVLVMASSRDALGAALERENDGKGMSADTIDEQLGEGVSDELFAGWSEVDGAGDLLGRQDLAALLESQAYGRSLRTAGARFDADDDSLDLELVANTDADELEEGDLPLEADADTPQVVLQKGAASGANANQSRTTTFLYRAIRTLRPNSRFVRMATKVERDLGISFEDDVLGQFDGESQTVIEPNGHLAARSNVRDPEALRKLLPELAPVLPDLAESLQGLQSQGLALLMLFAPDAPAPATPLAAAGLKTISTPSGETLYHLEGLKDVPGLPPGPKELFYGLIGDVFVVGTTRERALDIADADLEDLDDAEGAAVGYVNLSELEYEDSEWLSEMGLFDPELVKALGLKGLTTSVDMSLSRAHASVTLETR